MQAKTAEAVVTSQWQLSAVCGSSHPLSITQVAGRSPDA